MKFDFTGRNVIVTGGTRGIGRGISAAFLDAGARVFATYVENEAKAGEFRESMGEKASLLSLHRLDISDYPQVESFFRELESGEAAPDVLVNNAGIRKDNVLGMMPREDWLRVLDVHLNGTYNMTKLAIMAMSRRRRGRIITITSLTGKLGFPGQGNYAAAKAGQVGLTRAVAKEIATRGITVNCVCPGFIDTDFSADLPEKLRDSYQEMVPMRKFGKPEDVAAGVLFLASPEASYITGTVLEISGGL